MSPQVLLLYLADPLTFSVINLLLMYCLGFWGCLLLAKEHALGGLAVSAIAVTAVAVMLLLPVGVLPTWLRSAGANEGRWLVVERR